MQKSMFEIKCSDCGKTARVPFKPQRANQLTVKRAFQNACLNGQKVSARQTILIRNKRGHGEEKTCKETKMLASLLCSNGLTEHTTKLFRKK